MFSLEPEWKPTSPHLCQRIINKLIFTLSVIVAFSWWPFSDGKQRRDRIHAEKLSTERELF